MAVGCVCDACNAEWQGSGRARPQVYPCPALSAARQRLRLQTPGSRLQTAMQHSRPYLDQLNSKPRAGNMAARTQWLPAGSPQPLQR
jgi:hypothetical protein